MPNIHDTTLLHIPVRILTDSCSCELSTPLTHMYAVPSGIPLLFCTVSISGVELTDSS